jgi:cation transport ATPase
MYDYVCVSIILSPHEVGRFHFTPAVVYFKSNLADIGGDIRLTIVAHNCSHCHHKTVWWFMFFCMLHYLSSNLENEMMIPTDSSEFKCHHHCHHHHLHHNNNHHNHNSSHHNHHNHNNSHHNHHNHHYHYHKNNNNNSRVIIIIIITTIIIKMISISISIIIIVILIIIIIILSSCLMGRSVKDLVAHPQVLCSQNCICLMNSYHFCGICWRQIVRLWTTYIHFVGKLWFSPSLQIFNPETVGHLIRWTGPACTKDSVKAERQYIL